MDLLSVLLVSMKRTRRKGAKEMSVCSTRQCTRQCSSLEMKTCIISAEYMYSSVGPLLSLFLLLQTGLLKYSALHQCAFAVRERGAPVTKHQLDFISLTCIFKPIKSIRKAQGHHAEYT